MDNFKTIVLIAGTEHTRDFLHKQLNEYLGELTNIKSYAIDESLQGAFSEGELYVFSSKLVMDEIGFIPNKVSYVIATRTINYSNIDKLFFLPKGSDALFVNDVKDTTYSCIDNLMGLEVNHLKYFPYYPGIKEYKKCDIAVTSGEVDKVPSEIKTIVDLGSRPFDMATLIEIMHKLGYYDEKVTDVSLKYVKKIIELGKKLAAKNNEVVTLNRDLERIIIDINSMQNKNENKIVYKFRQDEPNLEVRNDILKKRYYGKYNFDDIIGVSQSIVIVKKLAKKIASTDLSVLIEGESGTGKELFASAIHNYSKRRDEPFLAVNFSAIPENLIESELFGYEDGAFTGAKKGGSTGFFEKANRGTIFLDEIGDASITVQARLLRVLQERELMKIGGDRLIPLDIRVVAATNKNLKKLICEGKFREDLYFRLKMGYLLIPPLRLRKGDVVLIARKYIENRTNISISHHVLKLLDGHEWHGNVRELINTLDYAIAVCDSSEINIEHLPMDFEDCVSRFESKYDENTEQIDGETKEILDSIYNAQKNGNAIGRKTLVNTLMDKGFLYTEQSIRTKLNNMEKLGLLTKYRGRAGTRLTDKGIGYINKKTE